MDGCKRIVTRQRTRWARSGQIVSNFTICSAMSASGCKADTRRIEISEFCEEEHLMGHDALHRFRSAFTMALVIRTATSAFESLGHDPAHQGTERFEPDACAVSPRDGTIDSLATLQSTLNGLLWVCIRLSLSSSFVRESKPFITGSTPKGVRYS